MYGFLEKALRDVIWYFLDKIHLLKQFYQFHPIECEWKSNYFMCANTGVNLVSMQSNPAWIFPCIAYFKPKWIVILISKHQSSRTQPITPKSKYSYFKNPSRYIGIRVCVNQKCVADMLQLISHSRKTWMRLLYYFLANKIENDGVYIDF